jgi:hypothetical protein
VFGKERMYIVSNSAGTLDDPQGKEASIIESNLGMYKLRTHVFCLTGKMNAITL